MFSKIGNVQIIVALMKEHGVRHIVLSAGTRHVPIAHSVENDPFFTCYSVVDERSAGYYALGLAKQLGEPVAIACTSSTATLNYSPPIAEAYYQNIPLLVLTGDRHPYRLHQLEDQMIDQVDMYRNYCKHCVNLPLVNNAEDEWYCQRLVNEALLELDHHGKGPVQINFPIASTIEDIADASVPELPAVNVIRRLELSRRPEMWDQAFGKLKSAKRILVIVGEGAPLPQKDIDAISQFAERFNCIIAVEHVSNLTCRNSRDTFLTVAAMPFGKFKGMLPDVVITFGGNFISKWKARLRGQGGNFEHWCITESGKVCDPFKSLTRIFECTPGEFFAYFAAKGAGLKNDCKYLNDMDKVTAGIDLPEIPYSNMMAIKMLSEKIQPNSMVHLSILNSVRIMQYFPLASGVTAYSNIGTDGIDGCMSTFLGSSRLDENRMSYLVIGDLSFFYDMNSVMLRDIKSNVRIMLVNNEGAAEFHYTMGEERLPNINVHIAAEHHKQARQWVESNGFNYLSARNEEELKQAIQAFSDPNAEGPMLLEVFTDKDFDGHNLRNFEAAIKESAPRVTNAGDVAAAVERKAFNFFKRK